MRYVFHRISCAHQKGGGGGLPVSDQIPSLDRLDLSGEVFVGRGLLEMLHVAPAVLHPRRVLGRRRRVFLQG